MYPFYKKLLTNNNKYYIILYFNIMNPTKKKEKGNKQIGYFQACHPEETYNISYFIYLAFLLSYFYI